MGCFSPRFSLHLPPVYPEPIPIPLIEKGIAYNAFPVPSDTKLLGKYFTPRIMFRDFRGILHPLNLQGKEEHFTELRENCVTFA